MDLDGRRVIRLIFGIHFDGNLEDTAVLGPVLGLVRKLSQEER